MLQFSTKSHRFPCTKLSKTAAKRNWRLFTKRIWKVLLFFLSFSFSKHFLSLGHCFNFFQITTLNTVFIKNEDMCSNSTESCIIFLWQNKTFLQHQSMWHGLTLLLKNKNYYFKNRSLKCLQNSGQIYLLGMITDGKNGISIFNSKSV